MLQQDTFWRDNLFHLDLEQLHDKADVLLDQMGFVDDGPRAGWTNGIICDSIKITLAKLSTFAPASISRTETFGMACNTVYGMYARIERYLAFSTFFWLRSLRH